MNYRLLVHQPIAISVERNEAFSLRPPNEYPIAQFRQRNADELEQHSNGGTQLAIEFASNHEDLIRATHEGLELADDVFAALALSTGAPLQPCVPIHIEKITNEPGTRIPIASFFGIERRAWSTSVGNAQIELIQRAFMHWGALESGDRFRRAVRRYRQALGREDWLEAFQDAYMGLEALEKPIAQELNVPVGHEIVEGKCDHCGKKYQRKRTVLSGIRAYICGDPDGSTPPEAAQARKEEWKTLSGLRTDIVHGLEDISKLQSRAHKALPATLHHLHDAACHLIHAHELESAGYSYARFALSQIIVMGFATKYRPKSKLEQWEPRIEIRPGQWVQHQTRGPIPEFSLFAREAEIEAAFTTLTKPLSDATSEDLEPLNTETDK